MNDTSTIRRYTRDQVPPDTRTERRRLRRMTDQDIARQIADNPDAAPLWTDEEVQRAQLVPPVTNRGRPISPAARLELRIEPTLKQWADKYAHTLGLNVSGLIRLLLAQERQRTQRGGG